MHEVKVTDEFFENTVAAMQHALRGKAVAITPGEGEAKLAEFSDRMSRVTTGSGR